MRHYELMVILDPSLDERTVAPSLDTFLNVVRQHGGTIDVDSRVGEFTEFTIRLPRASPAASTGAAA